MMMANARWLVRFMSLGLILRINAAQEVDSKMNLEDYQRYTPAPGEESGNSSPAPTLAPSEAPTTSAPSWSPSESPTTAEPSEAPTDVPTSSPTAEPTKSSGKGAPESTDESPTSAPTQPVKKETLLVTEAPTIAPTKAPTDKAVAETAEEDKEDQPWGLFTETLDYQSIIGEVFVDFSLYSPNVTNLEMNFMKLKMGVCGSLDALVCDQAHPIKEEGPEYCAVRDDILLKDGSPSQSRTEPSLVLSDYDVTVMALASTNVKDGSGVILGSSPISWTTWRMSYGILQLGPALKKHIVETYGSELNETEINAKGVQMLQDMMSENMKRTLADGVFQKDINGFMKDIMILASVVGEEVSTYEAIMSSSGSAAHMGQHLAGEDEEGGGLMVVFFFAGLGVACFVIVALLYFSFRSRRSVVRRKRTIVVLDDTSKSCTDSQESTSSPVVVVDAEEALKEDAPRAQQQTQQQETQRWEGTSSVGASSSVGPGEGDVESQWGRSMAQSSAYTGSISAITGVSGLEQSDTWSVGSMSIDLAEWS